MRSIKILIVDILKRFNTNLICILFEQTMAPSVQTDLINRHRRILRHRLKKINEENNTSYRLGQKNIDLLFYLKYIKFVKELATKAKQIAEIEGSSEIMPQHWKESGAELLDTFERENELK